MHHPARVVGLHYQKVKAIPVENQLHLIRLAQWTPAASASRREEAFQRSLLALPKAIQQRITTGNVEITHNQLDHAHKNFSLFAIQRFDYVFMPSSHHHLPGQARW